MTHRLDYSKVERLAAERGWTIAELAKQSGYTAPSAVYNMKTREVKRLMALARIAKALKVKIEDIVKES